LQIFCHSFHKYNIKDAIQTFGVDVCIAENRQRGAEPEELRQLERDEKGVHLFHLPAFRIPRKGAHLSIKLRDMVSCLGK